MSSISTFLLNQKEQQRYRSRHVIEQKNATEITIDQNKYINFCSNDYLGLSQHPKVIQALIEGTQKHGVGSGASHLVTGHSSAHHELENQLAEFIGQPRALLCSTGYMANLAISSALIKPTDAVFSDRLNHASLVDAALSSGAKHQRYLHNNTSSLAQKLNQHKKSKCQSIFILTDGVFSMDGDIANLPELSTLSKQYQAHLIVDDAHGLGVLGENGAGTSQHFSSSLAQPPILMGTLGKALGTFGAFVAAEENVIEMLIQRGRSYIYTTALPPAIANATLASLAIIRQEAWRRDKLNSLIDRFQRGILNTGYQLMPSSTPIQPLLIGSTASAIDLSQRLMQQGLFVSAIRPPTVPENTARLRITFSAEHTDDQVDLLLNALEGISHHDLKQ